MHLQTCPNWVIVCPVSGKPYPRDSWAKHEGSCSTEVKRKAAERKAKREEEAKKKDADAKKLKDEGKKREGKQRHSSCVECGDRILSYDVFKTLCRACQEEKRRLERKRDEVFAAMANPRKASSAVVGAPPPWELMAGMSPEELRERLEKVALATGGGGSGLGGMTGMTNMGGPAHDPSEGPMASRKRASRDMSPEELRAMLAQVAHDSLIYKNGNAVGAAPNPTSAPEPQAEARAQEIQENESLPRAEAIAPFVGSDEQGTLTFDVGEIFEILDQSDVWWEARDSEGNEGLVPSNYVQLIEDDDDDEIEVVIPENATPGVTLNIQVDGQTISVEVPADARPGESLFIRLPKPEDGAPTKENTPPKAQVDPKTAAAEEAANLAWGKLKEGEEEDDSGGYVDMDALKRFLTHEDNKVAGYIDQAAKVGALPKDMKAGRDVFVGLVSRLMLMQTSDAEVQKIRRLFQSYMDFRAFRRKSIYTTNEDQAKRAVEMAKALEKKQQEERKKKEEEKRAFEEEKKRKAQEARRRKEEKERERKQKTREEQERLRKAQEEARAAAIAAAEAEKLRIEKEETERLRLEEERRRLESEAAAARQRKAAEEAEARRRREAEAQRRRTAAEEAARRRREEEEIRRREAEEKKKLEEERVKLERAKAQAEKERLEREKEEQARLREERERQKRLEAEANAARLAKELEDAQRREREAAEAAAAAEEEARAAAQAAEREEQQRKRIERRRKLDEARRRREAAYRRRKEKEEAQNRRREAEQAATRKQEVLETSATTAAEVTAAKAAGSVERSMRGAKEEKGMQAATYHHKKNSEDGRLRWTAGNKVEVKFSKYGWTPVTIVRTFKDDQGDWLECVTASGDKKQVARMDTGMIRPLRSPKPVPVAETPAPIKIVTPASPTPTTPKRRQSLPRKFKRPTPTRKEGRDVARRAQTLRGTPKRSQRKLPLSPRHGAQLRGAVVGTQRNVHLTPTRRGFAGGVETKEDGGFVIVNQPNAVRSGNPTPSKPAPPRRSRRARGTPLPSRGGDDEKRVRRLQVMAYKAMEKGNHAEAERLVKRAIDLQKANLAKRPTTGITTTSIANRICEITMPRFWM